MRDLPFSFGNSNTENESNGGSGSAGVNLFGLGKLSTLTLINGRRAGGNSAYSLEHGGFADLNLIPSSAIREIQIAPGGTSVAYGSDAIAGTVNVLLHDSFVGNRIDGSYSNTTDGDASEQSLSFITGQSIGSKTQLTLTGEWYQRNAIYARDRTVSANADRRSQGGQNQGSPTFPGRINVAGSEYILQDGISSPSSLIGDYRPLDSAKDLYNFSSQAPAIPDIERKHVSAQINYALTDQLTLWTELMRSQNTFENGLAPAPWSGGYDFTFEGTTYNGHQSLLQAAQNSPHLPAGIAPANLGQINYRNFALGTLDIQQTKDAWRNLIGLRGDYEDWSWETAALWIQSQLDIEYSGIADEQLLEPLIQSGAFNPFASAFASGTIASGPLTGQSYDNAAALQQAARNGKTRFKESMWSYDAKASGPIYELQTGEILLASGIELRKERIQVASNSFLASGDNLGGASIQSYDAERAVGAFFIESLIPVWRTASGQELDLSLGLRSELYQDKSGSQKNHYNSIVYQTALAYSPKENLEFSLNQATSFRAPTLNESYGAPQIVHFIYDDPSGGTPESTRIPTEIRGNPKLDPETSQSFNFNINYKPEAIQGLSLSLNYYYIEIKDAIANNAQSIVNRNATDPSVAGVFRPGPQIFFIRSQWYNTAETVTEGLQYKVRYDQPTTAGDWTFQLGITQVLKYESQAQSGDDTISFLGQFSDPRTSSESIAGPGSIPKYKGFAQASWNLDRLTLGATLNYIHSLEDNPSFTANNQPRKISDWTSLDLMLQYQWPENDSVWLSHTTLTLGVENVIDTQPPFAAGSYADGYDSSLYSLAGRRISLSIGREF
ncbi:MAG: iron complex outermembrane receptor protein [Lentimonas sp.]